MSLFWIFFPTVVFIVVLSWTDLKSHVGYAFCISKEEGWWKFPIVWLESFFLPTCFLCSDKSRIDYKSVSALERFLRSCLSDADGISYRTRRKDSYTIEYNNRTIYFSMVDGESVGIDGFDRLVPPRVGFLMLAAARKIKKSEKEIKPKKKSLFS